MPRGWTPLEQRPRRAVGQCGLRQGLPGREGLEGRPPVGIVGLEGNAVRAGECLGDGERQCTVAVGVSPHQRCGPDFHAGQLLDRPVDAPPQRAGRHRVRRGGLGRHQHEHTACFLAGCREVEAESCRVSRQPGPHRHDDQAACTVVIARMGQRRGSRQCLDVAQCHGADRTGLDRGGANHRGNGCVLAIEQQQPGLVTDRPIEVAPDGYADQTRRGCAGFCLTRDRAAEHRPWQANPGKVQPEVGERGVAQPDTWR